MQVSGEEAEVPVSGDQPRVATSGEQPRAAISGEQPRVAASGEQPRVAISGEQPRVAASGEQPRVAASEGQPWAVAGMPVSAAGAAERHLEQQQQPLHRNPFDPSSRLRKVDMIFKLFDANNDGYLNRDEMAALVMAVNPRVRFTTAQINAILDEVFRGYGEFVAGDKGLRQDGLLRTYNDGAGDVDRDFDSLGLSLDGTAVVRATRAAAAAATSDEEDAESGYASFSRRLSASMSLSMRKTRNAAWPPSWTASPNNGIACSETWHIMEDVDTLLRRVESKVAGRRAAGGVAALGGGDLAAFRRSLAELAERADCARTQDEAFDAHMAMGRAVFDAGFYDESLARFRRATELRPADVRPYFRAGNALASDGRAGDAVASYAAALEAASSNGPLWAAMLPQVHVNMGVAMESQGLLLGACEHYREAAILSPTHHRALKLLGSAMLGAGESPSAAAAPLREAVLLRPDYADAYSDLGAALAAGGDTAAAEAALRKALALQPHHSDAMYNLAGIFRDAGRYGEAAEAYGRLLAAEPGHWRARLNRAVALLGGGDVAAAEAEMRAAFRLTNRVEIYDEINHLRQLQQQGNSGLLCITTSGDKAAAAAATTAAAATVDPFTRFLRSSSKTTTAPVMRCALGMRELQKATRLGRCSAPLVAHELLGGAAGGHHSKTIRKSEVEKLLRTRMLASLSVDAFQGTIKHINSRVMAALQPAAVAAATDRVDVGMLVALLAFVCGGSTERRKRVAFDALAWGGGGGGGGDTKRLGVEVTRDAVRDLLSRLDQIYGGGGRVLVLRKGGGGGETGVDDKEQLSYPEFVELLAEECELGAVMEALGKLEVSDRVKHRGVTCAVCSYEVIGPRFKEVSAGFSLCCWCYSQGKVPPDMLHEDYFCFKEYGSHADALKEKILLLGSKLPSF